MVKEETKKFVQNNRKLLQEVAAQKSPVAPIAAAFLTAVDVEGDERSRGAESASEDTDDSTDSEIKLEDIRRGEDIDGR